MTEKSCKTCKYQEIDFAHSPCSDCFRLPDHSKDNWEAKDWTPMKEWEIPWFVILIVLTFPISVGCFFILQFSADCFKTGNIFDAITGFVGLFLVSCSVIWWPLIWLHNYKEKRIEQQ